MLQQRVQIVRGEDNKIHVRGLVPGQQLFKMPDGRVHVFYTTRKASNTTALPITLYSTTNKDGKIGIIKNVASPVQAAKIESKPKNQIPIKISRIATYSTKSQEQNNAGMKTLQTLQLSGQRFRTILNSTPNKDAATSTQETLNTIQVFNYFNMEFFIYCLCVFKFITLMYQICQP